MRVKKSFDEFGTTTTFDKRADAETHGRAAAEARGYVYVRVERVCCGDGTAVWTPVWRWKDAAPKEETR